LNHTGPLPATGPYNYKYRDNAAGVGVTAYVIDTGINQHHVEFEGRAFRGPKFVTGFPTVDEDVLGHGTHVSGTIAGKTFGVAKKATIVGIKVFNDADEDSRATTGDIVAALQHVLREVKSVNPPRKAVVNLSLGGGPSEFLDDAVADLVRGGIPVVVAAGNGNVCCLHRCQERI
jgi:subtilisin family serine protease